MHFAPNTAPLAKASPLSDLNTSGSVDPTPPTPSPPKPAPGAPRCRNTHLPHVTARYPFKDAQSTMQQVLFQDALDASGEQQLSTSAAAHRDMQAALQAMTAKQKQPEAQLVSHPSKSQQAAQLQAGAAEVRNTPAGRAHERGRGGVASRFKGGKLPKPTKLCYGGERPKTATRPQTRVKGVKGGSPSRLPVRRAAPPVPPTRANATSVRPSGTALAKEVHPNRAGRSSMRHQQSSARHADESLRRLASAKYSRGWRRGGGRNSFASSSSRDSSVPSAAAPPLSPCSDATDRTSESPQTLGLRHSAADKFGETSNEADDTQAAVAAMYASLSKDAAAEARRNAAASGRSQLDEEAAQRRRVEAEQKAFRAATQGDDDAAAVFLGLKKAPGSGSTRRQGGHSARVAPPAVASLRRSQGAAALAVDKHEAAAAAELMQLTARMARATLAAEDVSQLASPAAARARHAAAATAAHLDHTASTPSKHAKFGAPLEALEGGDVDNLMSPDPRYRGEGGVELAAAEPMPELPPRDPSKPPTYLDTQLLPGGRGPRYLQSVTSRIAPLVKHFKQNKRQHASASSMQHSHSGSGAPAKLPASQAGALLYAVANGQDAVPTSREEEHAVRGHGPKLSAVTWSADQSRGGLPSVGGGTSSHPGLPGVSAGYTLSTTQLREERSREAQAQETAAAVVATRRAQALAAQGVRMSRAAVGWEVPTGPGAAPPEVPLPPSAASTLHRMRKAELRRSAASAGSVSAWPTAQLVTAHGGAVQVGEGGGASDSAPPRLPAWYSELVSGLQQVGIMLQSGTVPSSNSASVTSSEASATQAHTAPPVSVPHTAVSTPRDAPVPAGTPTAAVYAIQHDSRGVVTGHSALATARAFLRGPVHAALAGSEGPQGKQLPRIPRNAATQSPSGGGGCAEADQTAAQTWQDTPSVEGGAPVAVQGGGAATPTHEQHNALDSSGDDDWEAKLQDKGGQGGSAEDLFDLEGLHDAVEAVRGIASRGNAAVNELDLSSASSSSSSGFSGAGL